MNYHKINEIPVKVHGRTIKDACPLPIFWSRSGIEANIRGGELWVDIEVGCDYQEPWFVTEINGAFISRQMLLKGRHKVCLFKSRRTKKCQVLQRQSDGCGGSRFIYGHSRS